MPLAPLVLVAIITSRGPPAQAAVTRPQTLAWPWLSRSPSAAFHPWFGHVATAAIGALTALGTVLNVLSEKFLFDAVIGLGLAEARRAAP